MTFVESIFLKDGVYHNLEWHQRRVDQTHEELLKQKPFQLAEVIPKIEISGVFKVRIVYGQEGIDVTYIAYRKRKINSIEIVDASPFDYHLKFYDRQKINQLVAASRSDEIIIAIHGHLTDASYANTVFWDESNWYTPYTKLLNGVKRQVLLANGTIKETTISKTDLGAFSKLSLINAMLDLGELEFPVSEIKR